MEMFKVGFLYDDVFLSHENPGGHPEGAERLVRIVARLKAAPFWNHLHHLRPRLATVDELAAVHRKEYVEALAVAAPGFLDGDTYLSPGSYQAARFAAGAVLTAIEACREGRIERAFCAVRPPGHHAEAGHAMGFCLFNNVAVGARFAQRLGIARVFIVDFDVHHGNGTQHMFEDDPTVFYFSTHQFPHYPGTGSVREQGVGKGKGATRNIPLAAGATDRDYRQIYQETLPGLMREFAPDLVLVSAGYDIRQEDPLAGMRVTGDGIREIVRGILGSGGIPTVIALEGGYHLPALAESVEITLDELLTWSPDEAGRGPTG